jgi:hypothetical protein
MHLIFLQYLSEKMLTLIDTHLSNAKKEVYMRVQMLSQKLEVIKKETLIQFESALA